MKKLYLQNRKKSVFWNILLTGIAPTLCSCFILCLVFVFIIVSGTRSEEEAHEKNISYSVTSVLDSITRNSSVVCGNISDAQWFHDTFISYCLSEKPLTAINKHEITEDMSLFSVMYPYIDNISFIYFRNPETLFSSSGVYENISFYREHYPDKKEYLFFESAPDGFSRVESGGAAYLLYSANITDIANGSLKARVNVLFNEKELVETLNLISEREAFSYSFIDENGDVLWEAESGIYERGKCVNADSPASVPGLICRTRIPYSVARKTAYHSLVIFLLVLLLDIMICALLVWYFSKQNYEPLKETVERYYHGKSTDQNEFEVLNKIVDQAFRDREEAQASLDVVFPIARQRAIRGLLDGTSMDRSVLSSCGIDFPYPLFSVISIKTSLSDLFDRDMEMQLTTLAMEDFVRRSYEGLQMESCLYLHSSTGFTAVLNYNDPSDLKSFLARLYDKCTLSGASNTVIGVGGEVSEAGEIHISSDQAAFALNYSQASGSGGIFLYNDVITEAAVLFFYSHSEEVLLSKAVAAGNRDTAVQIIRNIAANNSEISAPYSLNILYSSICSTIVRAVQDLGVKLSLSYEPKPPNDIGSVEKRAVELASGICSKVQEKYSAAITEEDKKMLAYIDEHIFDKELSLSLVASVFGISQASASESFKRITGTKYIDYVNEKRIRKAVELIYTENLDLNKVYTMVGYVSMSTFRRNYQRFAAASRKGNKT